MHLKLTISILAPYFIFDSIVNTSNKQGVYWVDDFLPFNNLVIWNKKIFHRVNSKQEEQPEYMLKSSRNTKFKGEVNQIQVYIQTNALTDNHKTRALISFDTRGS